MGRDQLRLVCEPGPLLGARAWGLAGRDAGWLLADMGENVRV